MNPLDDRILGLLKMTPLIGGLPVKFLSSYLLLFLTAADPQDPPQMPKPGKEHQLLKQFEGKWEVAGKFMMDPSQPAVEIKGTETAKLGLGDFWLLSHFKGEFLGKPFEGRSTTGYSPAKKKYVGTWIDGMMPHLFVMEGDADEAGKVLTLIGDGFDPATGKTARERWAIEIKDVDTHTMSFYTTGADGKERKTGEMIYTRKKK
jgi:hypothetical protein